MGELWRARLVLAGLVLAGLVLVLGTRLRNGIKEGLRGASGRGWRLEHGVGKEMGRGEGKRGGGFGEGV